MMPPNADVHRHVVFSFDGAGPYRGLKDVEVEARLTDAEERLRIMSERFRQDQERIRTLSEENVRLSDALRPFADEAPQHARHGDECKYKHAARAIASSLGD